MSDERHEGQREFDLLDRVDLLIATLPPGDALRRELLDLRMEISQREEIFIEARQTIEKLEEVIKKVTSPANRIGTFLGNVGKETAHIVVGGADYYCNVDPRIPMAKLKKGTRVLVNEAFVIVGDLGFEPAGPVTKVTEVIGTDRLRVGNEHGTQSLVLQRSAQLTKTAVKQGDEVRVDSNYRMALEMMSAPGSHEHYLDNVPELPWSKVGGQERAIDAIKDAIELPLLHPDLFEKFHHATPKGFLLYGPPGCGKTLIGKATAYNLTRQLREKSREGFMPFLFIDEAESILGTRRASRYSNILSTLVPMFCSEMDGIDSLNDVVIILASNRADLIDPAILRPGRIDRKIKVNRPDKQGTREIYRIYLTDHLPYDGVLAKEADGLGASIERLIERFVDWQFTRRDENKFLEVTLRSGRKEMLYRSDLISGAIVASIVERAKAIAIKRAIATQQDQGIRETDLQLGFNAEYAENDIFPTTDVTEDWLKLIDYDPENVVKISPVKPVSDARAHATSGVI